MKKTPLKRKMTPHLKEQRDRDNELRAALIERYGLKCSECGSPHNIQMHHIRPKGMGGTRHEYTIDEVTLLCERCHSQITGEVQLQWITSKR